MCRPGPPCLLPKPSFPCIRRSPISLPVSNSKAIANQKDARRTKQGVIFMNVSARALLKTRRAPWAMSLTTQQGPFPVKRNDTYGKPLAGWNRNLCGSGSNTGGGGEEALVNRLGIIQPQLGETQPITSRESEYQMLDNDRVRIRSWTEDERWCWGGWWWWLPQQWLLRCVFRCVCVCVCVSVCWEDDMLKSWVHPGAGPVVQSCICIVSERLDNCFQLTYPIADKSPVFCQGVIIRQCYSASL